MLDLDKMAAEARERVHRSIGQRARWAKWALWREVRKAKKAYAPVSNAQRLLDDYTDAMMNEPELLRSYRQGQMMLGLQWSDKAYEDLCRGQQAMMNVGSAGGLLINMLGKRVLP